MSWVGHRLAFKKFRSAHLCQSARLRLQREVAMGRYLAHPNVLATIGGVMASNKNGILMEAAETSLQDVVEQHAADAKAALARGRPLDAHAQKSFHYKIACAMLEVATALESMHAKRVIHCDVKPANVLITHDRATDSLRAKLGDLGSCQMVDDVKASTRMSVLSGTIHYQAPESLSIPPRILQQYKATTLKHSQVSTSELRAPTSGRSACRCCRCSTRA
jgi:serine/threonine protein kinase